MRGREDPGGRDYAPPARPPEQQRVWVTTTSLQLRILVRHLVGRHVLSLLELVTYEHSYTTINLV